MVEDAPRDGSVMESQGRRMMRRRAQAKAKKREKN
jgi:hypothetical protein